jgi:hypothetical protein
MKETEVGEVRIYSDNEGGDVDVKVSVVDWGQKHSVAVRISVEGPAAGFWIDFTDGDAGEAIRLLQAGDLARSGAIRDRYDKKPLDGVKYLDGTEAESFDLKAVERALKGRVAGSETAIRAVALIIIQETSSLEAALIAAKIWRPPGEVPEPAPAPELSVRPPNFALAEALGFKVGDEVEVVTEIPLGDSGGVIPEGKRGTVINASGTMLTVSFRDIEPLIGFPSPVWVDPASVRIPLELPVFKPASYLVDDEVLAGESFERGIVLGTKGKVAEVLPGGLTIDWETPLGPKRRQDIDPAKVSLVRPRPPAPFQARLDDDEIEF